MKKRRGEVGDEKKKQKREKRKGEKRLLHTTIAQLLSICFSAQ